LGEEGELIKTVNLTKVYPDGTVALKGVDFDVQKGEIHGLLGENGAGKTTLTKILSGILKPTAGEIHVRNEKVTMKRPQDGLALGIGMVHQHFALVRRFTAFENIVLGTKVNPAGRKADTTKKQIEDLSSRLGLKVPLDELVENLSLGVQQRVEIIKMLYRNVDLLILDEPTSSLTPTESDELFKTLKKLKNEGRGIIFITHKLREVMENCDRITVLRQGQVSGRTDAGQVDPRTLARMMVGRDVVLELSRPPFSPGDVILAVRELTVLNNSGEEVVEQVSLSVRRGEIFGIAGVEGNGQTELAEAISGVKPLAKGQISLAGNDISHASPNLVRRSGAALIPEDRRFMGLVTEMTVAENTILGKQREKQFRSGYFTIAWKKVNNFTNSLIARFGIVTQGPKSVVKSMSGGNQQKLVVSRELSSEPDFILASQPTRGLDVASTEYMRKLLLQLRGANKGVLLISSDLDEIFQLADTIGVMYEGKLIDVVSSEGLTRDKIGLLMGGVKE